MFVCVYVFFFRQRFLRNYWTLDFEIWYKHLVLMELIEFRVLQPSQPIRVMLSWSVYLTTLFLGRHSPLSTYQLFVHILSPEIKHWVLCKRESGLLMDCGPLVTLSSCSPSHHIPSKRGLLRKEGICSKGDQIISF